MALLCKETESMPTKGFDGQLWETKPRGEVKDSKEEECKSIFFWSSN
jgi:hypothetical protein